MRRRDDGGHCSRSGPGKIVRRQEGGRCPAWLGPGSALPARTRSRYSPLRSLAEQGFSGTDTRSWYVYRRAKQCVTRVLGEGKSKPDDPAHLPGSPATTLKSGKTEWPPVSLSRWLPKPSPPSGSLSQGMYCFWSQEHHRFRAIITGPLSRQVSPLSSTTLPRRPTIGRTLSAPPPGAWPAPARRECPPVPGSSAIRSGSSR